MESSEDESPEHKVVEIATPKEKKKKLKKEGPKQHLIMCSKDCRYNVIKRVCRKMDFKMDPDENSDWDVYWSDTGVLPEFIQKLKTHQRINANPNIQALAWKNNLAKNLTRMSKVYKDDYSFFPQTW